MYWSGSWDEGFKSCLVKIITPDVEQAGTGKRGAFEIIVGKTHFFLMPEVTVSLVVLLQITEFKEQRWGGQSSVACS